ncbi:MAG: nucleotide exchange factor GrpE [Rikenellaceae bacterium]
MTEEKVYNQAVNGDEGFIEGDGYPSCNGSPCANMADDSEFEEPVTDTLSDDAPESEEATAAAPGAAKEEESSEWRDKFLRLQAEFDNYRKRTLREKMDLVQSGGADTLKAFLPVVDDIDRAVVAMAKSEDVVALRQGVDLIAAKFGEILKQRGVVEIEAMGLELDTDHHEAIARFAAGEDQKGKIIDVVQKGYILGDKVLRFAKVVVGE